MGMSIDDAIKRINNIMFTKFTTVKDEDAFFTAIDTMRKYQEIEQIYQKWNEVNDFSYNQAMQKIGEVLEDGKHF